MLLTAITLIRPSVLHYANVVWTRLGILLGKVMTPVVTGLLLYVVFTPVAIILRLRGKDLLKLSPDPAAESYWEIRNPADERISMINQF